jgi:hypothetical protein
VGMLGMAEGCWGVYFLYPEPVTRFNVEVKFSGWTFDSCISEIQEKILDRLGPQCACPRSQTLCNDWHPRCFLWQHVYRKVKNIDIMKGPRHLF